MAGWVWRRQDRLMRRVDAGSSEAIYALISLLILRGDLRIPTRRSRAGDKRAARALVCARRVTVALTARADAGDDYAARQLAEWLHYRGEKVALTKRADAGDEHASYALALLLLGHYDQATLTARADAGERSAASALAQLLHDRGEVETLTARADAGDEAAARQLVALLGRRDLSALTARAEAGDEIAAAYRDNLVKWRAEAARGAVEAAFDDYSISDFSITSDGYTASDFGDVV